MAPPLPDATFEDIVISNPLIFTFTVDDPPQNIPAPVVALLLEIETGDLEVLVSILRAQRACIPPP